MRDDTGWCPRNCRSRAALQQHVPTRTVGADTACAHRRLINTKTITGWVDTSGPRRGNAIIARGNIPLSSIVRGDVYRWVHNIVGGCVYRVKTYWSIVQTLFIAVASPSSIVQVSIVRRGTLPPHCGGNGLTCTFPTLSSPTIAIDRQRCQSVVVANGQRQTNTLSAIETAIFLFHTWYTIVQGASKSYVIHSIVPTAHCSLNTQIVCLAYRSTWHFVSVNISIAIVDRNVLMVAGDVCI